ncbi:early endosome antigen 1-like [Macrobrachium rosenbergii]|uniref:early endosome antigen 1-like n=1 Tax=Macrobrachium rosenbergii TaxID=79674 RepID=UPI0034D528C4
MSIGPASNVQRKTSTGPSGASSKSALMDPGLEAACGIKNLLLFAVFGLVIAVTRHMMDNTQKQDTEDGAGKIRALEEEVCLEREGKKSLTMLNVTLIQRLHDLQKDLDERRKEPEKGKEEGIQSTTARFNKQRVEQQSLEDKIRLLESEKQLMQKEMATQENAKNMLEEEIAQMKAENKQLAKDGAAIQVLSDALNNKVMSLTAQLAKISCQLRQQEEAAVQLETELREMKEEEIRMTKRTRDLECALNCCKTEKEDLQVKVRELQEQAERLSKENGSLQCQLQEKDMRLGQQDNLLKEKDRRLEDMTRLASSVDEKKNVLEQELRNLQAKNDMLQRDFDNLQMRKEHLERVNDGLQKQLWVLTRWHETVAAGFNQTERNWQDRSNIPAYKGLDMDFKKSLSSPVLRGSSRDREDSREKRECKEAEEEEREVVGLTSSRLI